MIMAISKGLDGAIINALDQKMMAGIIAAEAPAGKDTDCMKYLEQYRSGLFHIKRTVRSLSRNLFQDKTFDGLHKKRLQKHVHSPRFENPSNN